MNFRGEKSQKNRASACLYVLLLAVFCGSSGCFLRNADHPLHEEQVLEHFNAVATEIEYPDVTTPVNEETASTSAPITINDGGPRKFWDLTLEEAIKIALTNSTVLRNLGGQVLTSPSSLQTIHAPTIQETDPRFGVDAALSAFDASFFSDWFFENNDRPLNNPSFGGGRTFRQDLALFDSGISKKTAYGSDLTLRKTIDYNFNNTPGNPLPGAWNVLIDAEVRQPLLQKSGVDFNRIAGPGATPGSYNGVLIARINTDISLADFEIGVRNLLTDVEQQYWELYFAYRDLDAKVAARERALETWRRIHALYVTGRRGGEAEKEAQAREQYFRLEEDVQNALTGRQFQKSRTIALSFRGINGVHANERQLRLLLGLSISDRRLIRPADEPKMAKAVFDWGEILHESLSRRAELRRQQWKVKQRELELVASRNFLYPTLDAVGRYRWRGYGRDLLNPDGGRPRFDNAYADLVTGDFQEWQLGFEFSLPIGFRQAHAGVRNAQLNLARERAVLEQQERDVTHDLASAISEMERAYAVAQTNFNRRLAGRQQLEALEAVYVDADENQKARILDLLLDSQRRLADSESRYYRAIVEYQMAVTQIHFQKGSLLDYTDVHLSEGAWPEKAGHDMDRRNSMRMRSWRLTNFLLSSPPPVSQGPYMQHTELGDEELQEDLKDQHGQNDAFPAPPIDVEPAPPIDVEREPLSRHSVPLLPTTPIDSPSNFGESAPRTAGEEVQASPSPVFVNRSGTRTSDFGFFNGDPIIHDQSIAPAISKTAEYSPAPINYNVAPQPVNQQTFEYRADVRRPEPSNGIDFYNRHANRDPEERLFQQRDSNVDSTSAFAPFSSMQKATPASYQRPYEGLPSASEKHIRWQYER